MGGRSVAALVGKKEIVTNKGVCYKTRPLKELETVSSYGMSGGGLYYKGCLIGLCSGSNTGSGKLQNWIRNNMLKPLVALGFKAPYVNYGNINQNNKNFVNFFVYIPYYANWVEEMIEKHYSLKG